MFVYILNIVLVCIYALFLLRDEESRVPVGGFGKGGKGGKGGKDVQASKSGEGGNADNESKGNENRFLDIFSKRNVFIVLCFCQCLIISAVRYDVGLDYQMYAIGFKSMAASGFSSMTYEDWEIGYILLNKIVGLLTRDVNVMMFITSALALAGPFYMIWRYSKNPFMSVFLFLNTYLFYLDMNFIRQGIAMSIMCFAYGFLQDRKMWRYILLIAIAATFHLPVIYLIPVYFFTYIKLNLKTMPIYAAAVIIYFVASDAVLNVVLSHFHQEYLGSRFIRLGLAKYYAIIPLILCIALVALVFYMDFDLPKHMNVLTHLMLMMGFWQIAMTKHSLFERFSYYTMPFMLIAIPEAVHIFKDKFSERTMEALANKFQDDSDGLQEAQTKAKKKLEIIVLAVDAVVLIAMFAYNLMGLIIPERGAHGALPYNNIFGLDLPNIDGWFKR